MYESHPLTKTCTKVGQVDSNGFCGDAHYDRFRKKKSAIMIDSTHLSYMLIVSTIVIGALLWSPFVAHKHVPHPGLSPHYYGVWSPTSHQGSFRLWIGNCTDCIAIRCNANRHVNIQDSWIISLKNQEWGMASIIVQSNLMQYSESKIHAYIAQAITLRTWKI